MFAYTGDTGPSPDLVRLASRADVFLAEATLPEHPSGSEGHLSSAKQAGETAAGPCSRRLVLTHLSPSTDRDVAAAAARRFLDDEVSIARAGLVVDLD